MATSLKKVELDSKAAAKLIKTAKKMGVYTESVPKTDKEKNDAVNEIVAFCIDAWVNENVRPDSDDEDEATAAEQVIELLELADIEVDDDNNITYPDEDEDEDDDDEDEDDDEEDDDEDEDEDEDEEEWDEESLSELKTPALKEVANSFGVEVPDGKIGSKRKADIIAGILEAQEESDDDDDDDEAPFDIDDYIEEYDDLSAANKVKAIKKLKLDPEDEDDAAVLEAIRDYEDEQDKPASRVMDYLSELLPEDDEDEEEDEEEDDDEEEDEDEDDDEPIEGYNDASIAELKEALIEAAQEEDEDERLTAEHIEAIVEYEKENKNRKSFVKWLEGDLTEMLEEEEDDEEDEPEPPKKSKKNKGKGKKSDPDDEDDVDNAVAKDDDEFIERVAEAVLRKISERIVP